MDIDSALRASGLKSFFDRANLPVGLPWVRGLEMALNAAKAVIVLIGARGLGNTQQYERDLAFYRQTRDPSFPIVPVILPGAQIQSPFNFLQILTWIDFSQVSKVSDAPNELERLLAAVQPWCRDARPDQLPTQERPSPELLGYSAKTSSCASPWSAGCAFPNSPYAPWAGIL